MDLISGVIFTGIAFVLAVLFFFGIAVWLEIQPQKKSAPSGRVPAFHKPPVQRCPPDGDVRRGMCSTTGGAQGPWPRVNL